MRAREMYGPHSITNSGGLFSSIIFSSSCFYPVLTVGEVACGSADTP